MIHQAHVHKHKYSLYIVLLRGTKCCSSQGKNFLAKSRLEYQSQRQVEMVVLDSLNFRVFVGLWYKAGAINFDSLLFLTPHFLQRRAVPLRHRGTAKSVEINLGTNGCECAALPVLQIVRGAA